MGLQQNQQQKEQWARVLILSLMVLVCVALTIFVNGYWHNQTVYTQLFYVPILVAAIWYHRKVVYLSLFFGMLHIAVNTLDIAGSTIAIGTFDPATLMRAIMFLFVGILAGRIAEQKDALNEQLKRSNSELSSIIEFYPDATLIIDNDGKVVAWNRAMEAMTGFQSADIIGKGDMEYAVPFYGRRVPTLIDLIGTPVEEIRTKYSDVLVSDGRLEAVATKAKIRGNDAPVLHATASKLFGADGRAIGAIESVRDITAQKRLEIELGQKLKELEYQHDELELQEEELARQNDELLHVFNLLKESEEKHRAIVESVDDALMVIDTGKKFTFFNRRAEEITGYKSEELIGRSILDLVDTELRARVSDGIDQIVRGRIAPGYEMVLTGKNGRHFPAEMNASIIKDASGSPAGLIAAFRDITQRRQAEDILKRYQVLSQYAYDIILFVRGDGRIIEANDAAVLTYGYRRDELLEMSITDLRASDPGEIVARQMEQADKGGIIFETTHRCKDGKLVPVEVSSRGVTMGTDRVLLSIVRDISDRKRAGELQRESDERFHNVANSTLEAIISTDEDMGILFWNKAAERIFGYAGDEIIGRPITVLMPPDMHPGFMRAKDAYAQSKTFGILNKTVQFTAVRKDGTDFPVEMSLASWTQGGRIMFSAVVRDITERKRSEDELRKLSRAVEESPATVVITDVNGNIEYVNPKFTQVTGYTLAEALGRNPRMLKSGDKTREDYRHLWDTILAGKEWRGEFHNKKKNGDLYWESAVISPLKDATGKITNFIAVKEDITDRKLAEDALHASEARFRNIFEDSAVGIYLIDVNGGILDSNEAIRQMLGYAGDELQKLTAKEITYPDDFEEDRRRFVEMLEGAFDSYQIEKRYVRKDGSIMWGRLFKSIVRDQAGKPLYCISMVEDFTERKAGEEALSYKNKELGIISGIAAIINRSNSIEEVLEGTLNGSLELLEMDAGAIYLADPVDRSRLVLRAFVPRTEAGLDIEPRKSVRADPSLNTEKVFQHTDGGTAPFGEIFVGRTAIIIVPILLKGFAIGLMAFCPDATTGRQGELPDLLSIGSQLGVAIDNHTLMRTLRATSNYMAEIINESPDAIITADSRGNIMSSNKRVARLLQYGMVDLSGMNMSQLLPPDAAGLLLDGDRSYVRDFMRKDGTIITLNISTSRFESGDVPGGFIIALKDLSEIAGLKIVPIAETAVEGARKYHFEKGFMYLLDKTGGGDCMDVFADQVKHNIQGLCVTRHNPKKIREQYGLEKTPIVWLNGSDLPSDESCIKPDNLTGLGATIYKFLSEANDGIVLLDGTEYLVARNSFDSVLKFLHLMNDRVMVSNCPVLLCLDPLSLETRQFHLLRTELREFEEQ